MRVDFSQLDEVLSRVRHTLASDTVVEIYTFLCFRQGTVTSFNGKTGTVTKSDLDPLGDFCVNGKEFCSVVSSISDRSGEITFADDWVFIKAGQFRTKLPVYPVDDYPNIHPDDISNRICECAFISEALKTVTVFVEKDPAKEKIIGVGFKDHWVCTTDGKRLTRASILGPEHETFTISRDAAEQIARIGDPDFMFKSQGNIGAYYEDTDTIMLSRTPAEQFPFEFFEKVYSLDRNVNVDVPDTFRKALDRVRSLSKDDEGAIILQGTGDHLKISTVATEIGEASDVIVMKSPHFTVKLKGNSLGTLMGRLKPTTVDLTQVTKGDGSMVTFSGEKFDCIFAAML